jgi:hypothetical protein
MRNEPWPAEPSAIKQTPPEKGLRLSWQRDTRVNRIEKGLEAGIRPNGGPAETRSEA